MPASITASMLYNLVLCPHRVERDLFADPAERDPANAFVQMLWERGTAYEQQVVRGLGAAPLDLKAGTEEERERATLDAMRAGTPLVYGGRLRHGDLVGEPDLLRLEGGGYVAGDVKSGRGEEGGDDEGPGRLKLHYAVQLALYTDLLERLGFSAGRRAFVWDVTGAEVTYAFDEPRGAKKPGTWWDAYRLHLDSAREIVERRETTRPALCGDCKQCHWYTACTRRVEEEGDLTLVPELGRSRRDRLAPHFADVRAFADADLRAVLARDPAAFKGLGEKQVARWQARARLQVSGGRPYATQPLALPEGDPILYFDVETDPMLDFCYLHGFWVVERGHGRFVEFHTRDDSREEEARAFAEAIAFVRSHDGAPIVHYSPYERVTWRALAERHAHVPGAAEAEALMSKPRAFDLYNDAVRPHTQWPTRDYSIKSLAKYLGFRWRDTHPSGAASIQWFQEWLCTRDDAGLRRILEYNEDDCIAMQVVLDALRAMPVKPGV
jgi:uncharacterized protein